MRFPVLNSPRQSSAHLLARPRLGRVFGLAGGDRTLAPNARGPMCIDSGSSRFGPLLAAPAKPETSASPNEPIDPRAGAPDTQQRPQ